MMLTPNELQFMNVLWGADAPLTSSEILNRSVDKTWKDASLHTILSKLLAKGAIAEHGFVKDGKAISRTFIPILASEEYYIEFFSDYPAKDIPKLFSALMRREDFKAETIGKLEDLIQKRREELNVGDK